MLPIVRGSRKNLPFVILVVAAYRASAGLAEPHAVGLAVTYQPLHRLRFQEHTGWQPWLDQIAEGRLCACLAQTSVPVTEDDRCGGLDSTILGEMDARVSTKSNI